MPEENEFSFLHFDSEIPMGYLKCKHQIENCILSGAQKDLDCSCPTGNGCLINR